MGHCCSASPRPASVFCSSAHVPFLCHLVFNAVPLKARRHSTAARACSEGSPAIHGASILKEAVLNQLQVSAGGYTVRLPNCSGGTTLKCVPHSVLDVLSGNQLWLPTVIVRSLMCPRLLSFPPLHPYFPTPLGVLLKSPRRCCIRILLRRSSLGESHPKTQALNRPWIWFKKTLFLQTFMCLFTTVIHFFKFLRGFY